MTEVQPAEATQPKAKSFTERFVDLENIVVRMSYAINFQAKTLEGMLTKIDALNEEVKKLHTVKKIVNAIMQLSADGSSNFSIEKVAERVELMDAQAAQKQMAKDLADGAARVVESIDNDMNVFEFTTLEGGTYGITGLGNLTPDLKALLMGKKAGDEINNDFKITTVYSYAPVQAPDTVTL